MDVSFLVLNYNRPLETRLCLESIKRFTPELDKEVILLNNGGRDEDFIFQAYKDGLIDKLIFRRKNQGCGLGTRELFNDFNLDCNLVVYIQCDQFLIRNYSKKEFDSHCNMIYNEGMFYIDLAGNQGHGKYSERAHLIDKRKYNQIPNDIGGPGPYADRKWTEQAVQEYIEEQKLKFYSVRPLLVADNGKHSVRQYPCGGELVLFTDTKQLFITKPIKQRIDFPNLKLTDSEWELILSDKWINGTIPKQHCNDSFTCWNDIYRNDILNNIK